MCFNFGRGGKDWPGISVLKAYYHSSQNKRACMTGAKNETRGSYRLRVRSRLMVKGKEKINMLSQTHRATMTETS